jgi:transcriptional regulator with XRE-family HTH domain
MSAVTESRVARADRRTAVARLRLGSELRTARLIAGLSLAQVARALGISTSEASRIERGEAPWVDLTTLHRFAAIVGLDLWVRTYPGGEPLRDLAHLRLTDAFRTLLGPGLVVRAEVPIGDPRDLRAWDLTLTDGANDTCGVELETRLVDGQDQTRRLVRKRADGDVSRILLVVADTRTNRLAIRAAAGLLTAVVTIDDSQAREALAAGRIPPRDALILVPLGGSPVGRQLATPATAPMVHAPVPRESGLGLPGGRQQR